MQSRAFAAAGSHTRETCQTPSKSDQTRTLLNTLTKHNTGDYTTKSPGELWDQVPYEGKLQILGFIAFLEFFGELGERTRSRGGRARARGTATAGRRAWLRLRTATRGAVRAGCRGGRARTTGSSRRALKPKRAISRQSASRLQRPSLLKGVAWATRLGRRLSVT